MRSIWIPEDLAERLADDALTRGVTVDEIAVELLVQRMPAGDSPMTLEGLVGLGESGESDVSEQLSHLD